MAAAFDPGSSSGYDPMTSSDGPEMLDSPSTSSFYNTPTRYDAPMRLSSPLPAAVSYATQFQSVARRRPRPAASSASQWASSSSRSTAGAHDQRVYKSRTSARRPISPLTPNTSASNPNSSSSSSSLRLVYANARRIAADAARSSSKSNKYSRDLSLGRPENPFAPGAYALGAMRNGEWEEWTDDEEREMAMEQRRDIWQRNRAFEMQAVDQLGAVEEEFEDVQDDFNGYLEQEPPDDLLDLYSGSDLIDMSRSIPRIPSLASIPGLSTEEEMSSDDLEMQEAQEDATWPVTPVVDPSRAFQDFLQVLSTSSCPKCQCSDAGTIQNYDQQGARCIRCDWLVSILALQASSLEFAAHIPAKTQQQHLPIFAWDLHTETLVLCSGCDESFAA
ncbi:hypothetical protein MVLG_03142 [Microbotryum lychnidis-dioicae p1A1 Lamole]|uniref:Uncharacterized protein n=1 Tax=Microbotryum lychnidis-dioicae (strain p1A1 Lamole / MvSl-1064) TaxID=683840 RepID=U5H7A6_USTV1|nr:hypothetical protein MVLG_03142 [Microbotryum lychnidis-dioicae p1A1 Lamole]|eukprot:KDE06490.1 hypothetical protein MVLG_03142 [Microbotryum lychnidis-dioicae p1A1 Lamole]